MATYKLLFSLLLLILTISCASAARVLDEEVPAAGSAVGGGGAVPPVPTTTPGAIPAVGSAVGGGGGAVPHVPITTASGAIPAAGSAAGGGAVNGKEPLIFYMHDIIGGSNPTARAVTGIVTNPAVNGQVPFAKPNGANLPVNSGVNVNSNNNGILNNNNVPFLTGLGGNSANVIQNQNNGNNQFNGNNQLPVLSGGQLPAGSTIEKFMFGTLTVIDDELTEGQELGSGLVGKAQGFYIASSEDGTSQTMAFTAMFESGGYVDTLSFFGVHRTAVSESQLAIMGGTGKFVNAKGYATVKTFPEVNQHETDGVETLLQFTLYLAY